MQSKPYTVSRNVLSRLTAFYYLRTFWFILIGPFLFGLGLILLGPNQMSRFFGFILAAWPMTVFARALLLTGKAARAWAKPTVMTITKDAFLFESETEPVSRFQLKFEGVRRVVPLLGFYLIQTRRLAFVPIPASAAPDQFPESLEFLKKQA